MEKNPLESRMKLEPNLKKKKGSPMKPTTKRTTVSLLLALVLITLATKSVATAPPPPLPNPILYLMGIEAYQVGGKEFIRYKYDVLNKGDYPAAMFAPAPALPPCGANTKSSRTWVDIFDSRGKRLYGFCALGSPADLNGIWFALESDVVPPSWVYIELNDRQTNTKYKSNLAETTP
jgi:hypothetical protein